MIEQCAPVADTTHKALDAWQLVDVQSCVWWWWDREWVNGREPEMGNGRVKCLRLVHLAVDM